MVSLEEGEFGNMQHLAQCLATCQQLSCTRRSSLPLFFYLHTAHLHRYPGQGVLLFQSFFKFLFFHSLTAPEPFPPLTWDALPFPRWKP